MFGEYIRFRFKKFTDIHIALGYDKAKDFTFFINNNMKLKSKEPTGK